MSTTKTILNQVKATLSADATLSGYVQKFELGMRRGLAEQDFPIVMIEPASMVENYPSFPTIDAHLVVTIAAYTRVFDMDALLVGDPNYKGVLDLEKDVKLALGAQYPTLGGTVLEFTFPRTEFAISRNLASFPVRGVLIDCELHFRTQLDTRA